MEAQTPGLSSDQVSRVMCTREPAVGLAETGAATAIQASLSAQSCRLHTPTDADPERLPQEMSPTSRAFLDLPD